MRTHHTITVTIPTAAICRFSAGMLAGLVIGSAVVVGLTPVAAAALVLTLAAMRSPVAEVRPELPAAYEPPMASEWHPAIVAYAGMPRRARDDLDLFVDRVLVEKWRTAA
jgi:hypothetical protein